MLIIYLLEGFYGFFWQIIAAGLIVYGTPLQGLGANIHAGFFIIGAGLPMESLAAMLSSLIADPMER